MTDGDIVQVGNKVVDTPDRAKLWRYHKPEGLVTTHKDPEGRPTVFERLPEHLPRVVSVGRLDLNSEGLLLLTNDGGLARRLELPSNGWIRRYRVRVHGVVPERALGGLADGVVVEGVRYGPIEAAVDSRAISNTWLSVALREGRNREVRKVMAHLNLQVTRLIRVAYGPFQLGNLERGAVDEISGKVLREQLPDDRQRWACGPAKGKAPLRIIAGRWRGRTLRAPPGQATRPTAERLRQAVFDMLLHAPWGGPGGLDGHGGAGRVCRHGRAGAGSAVPRGRVGRVHGARPRGAGRPARQRGRVQRGAGPGHRGGRAAPAAGPPVRAGVPGPALRRGAAAPRLGRPGARRDGSRPARWWWRNPRGTKRRTLGTLLADRTHGAGRVTFWRALTAS